MITPWDPIGDIDSRESDLVGNARTCCLPNCLPSFLASVGHTQRSHVRPKIRGALHDVIRMLKVPLAKIVRHLRAGGACHAPSQC